MTPRKEVRVKITGDETQLTKSVARANAGLKRLGRSFNQLTIGLAKTAAVAGGIGFALKKGVLDPFAEQQLALASLSAALEATGKDPLAGLAAIADEAARLQSVTTAADESLIKASATLATLASGLDTDELVRAQTAIVALADTFLKGDLEQAALLLGKTLGSSVNALSRYGVEVDASASASEKLAAILGSDTLGAAFEVAQAKAKTLAGRMTQLKNVFGDLREVLGGIVVESLTMTDSAKDMSDRIRELTDRIDANSAKWVAWARVGIESTKLVGEVMAGLVRVAFNVGQLIGRAFDIPAQLMIGAFAEAFNKIQELANRLLEQLDRIPFLDLDFRFDTSEANQFFARAKIQAFELGQDLDDIGDAVAGIADAWLAVQEAAEKARRAQGSGAAPALPPALGGGTTTDGDGAGTGASAGKMEALAKQLQDRLVAITKTAVDNMQLEYDRLEEHILAVDGRISEDWQSVLDDMAAKIESAGLAEGFSSVIDAISGTIDDLGADAKGPLKALRAEILETKGGAEAFKSELEEIDALLKGLTTEIDVSFIGGIMDQLGSILDPTAIASAALGNLLSGGISSLTSAVGNLLGGIFGQSDEQRANTAAVRKNMEAADRLADNLNALSAETVTLPFDALEQMLNDWRGTFESRRDESEFVQARLKEYGLTIADIEAIAASMGQEFESLDRDAEALRIGLANLNTFTRDFALLQKQFALFDIEDPAEKFASVMDLLASQVSDEFGAVLSELTPENFDAFLEQFREGFGDFDSRELLGDDVTFEQFLDAIGFAESALDGFGTEADKATAALRNVPSGFKVALGRFQASDLETLGDRIDFERADRIDFERADPIDPDDFEGGDFTRPGPITIEGDLVLQGVENTRDLLDQLENEIQWRARTGSSVIATTTGMRR